MKVSYEVREVRILYEKEFTHCYVFLSTLENCPSFVHGWHYELFNGKIPVADILEEQFSKVPFWPRKSPNSSM